MRTVGSRCETTDELVHLRESGDRPDHLTRRDAPWPPTEPRANPDRATDAGSLKGAEELHVAAEDGGRSARGPVPAAEEAAVDELADGRRR
jgi:hypothetical protein